MAGFLFPSNTSTPQPRLSFVTRSGVSLVQESLLRPLFRPFTYSVCLRVYPSTGWFKYAAPVRTANLNSVNYSMSPNREDFHALRRLLMRIAVSILEFTSQGVVGG
jgi:hypothetical protein